SRDDRWGRRHQGGGRGGAGGPRGGPARGPHQPRARPRPPGPVPRPGPARRHRPARARRRQHGHVPRLRRPRGAVRSRGQTGRGHRLVTTADLGAARARRSTLIRPARPTLLTLLDRPLACYYLVVGTTALLLALGLVMVLSASSVTSFTSSGS